MVMSVRGPAKVTKRAIHPKVRELHGGDLPGYIKGKHYTVYMKQAKQLAQDGKVQPIVDMAFTAFEDKERIGSFLTEYFPVPTGCYWDFAVLYRKLKDYAREVAILERYAKQMQAKHVTGRASTDALERLEKARALLAKNQEN